MTKTATKDETELIDETLKHLAEALDVKLLAETRKRLVKQVTKAFYPQPTDKVKRQKITRSEVELIKAEYEQMVAEGNPSMARLGAKWGITASTVSRYVNKTLQA
jgi:hypothetical protein